MYCLSSFCCVCLSIKPELINLNKPDDDSIPIINKLIFIAFGHEKLDLDVIKLICGSCLKELRIAYKFKTTCLTSNELLIGYNSQLKYFTGSIGLITHLDVNISATERVISDNSKNTVRIVPKSKYKPRPLSKQKKLWIKQEPEDKTVGFKCKHCKETFNSAMRRLIHFNKTHHKNLRKFKKSTTLSTSETLKCSCSMCQQSFSNAKLLKCHILKVHFNDSKRFCRHCNHHFSNRKSFINHMKDRHNYNNFTCQICNTKYLKEINYNKHMTRHAENKIIKKSRKTKQTDAKKLKMITRYLVCNTCDEIFINSVQLQRHMLSHGKSSFSIDNTFENGPNDPDNQILREILNSPPNFPTESPEVPSELSENIEIIPEIKLEPIVEIKEEFFDDPIPFFDVESNITDSVSNNNEHQLETESKPDEGSSNSSVEINKYECNICQKQFTVKSFLNAHLLIHNNASGPNFDCIQCKQHFTDKTDFAQHILSNACMSLSSIKKLSCNVCFKLFKYEFSLNQHLRSHEIINM